jgi:hypothetical protein
MPDPRIRDVRAIEVIVQHGGEDDRQREERIGWAIELPRVDEVLWVAYSGPEDFLGMYTTPHDAYRVICEVNA